MTEPMRIRSGSPDINAIMLLDINDGKQQEMSYERITKMKY